MQGNFQRVFSKFKEYIIVTALLIISLSLLSLNENPAVKKIRVYALGSLAVFNSLVSDFAEIFSPQGELVSAKKENAELMLKLNMLREYGLENNELKNLLSFNDTSGYPLVAGKVVSRLVSKVQGTFIINIGRSDSILVGMPVINNKGLVGLVTDISNDFSVVRTLQNSNLKLAVKDQRSNINGVISWDGIQLLIKNIPVTSDIMQGDRIVTSEFSTIVPPEIPVGIVSNKSNTVSGLLSRVTVQPFVEFDQIKNVFVLQLVQSSQIDSLELNLLRKE